MARSGLVAGLRDEDAEVVVAEVGEQVAATGDILQAFAELADVLGGGRLAVRLGDLVIVLGGQHQHRKAAAALAVEAVDRGVDRAGQRVRLGRPAWLATDWRLARTEVVVIPIAQRGFCRAPARRPVDITLPMYWPRIRKASASVSAQRRIVLLHVEQTADV